MNSPAEPGPVLEGVGLSKHFRVRTGRWPGTGLVHAADDISITLNRSAVTAVVGESGSGKSTLSRLLARTTKPTAGTLRLDGNELDLSTRADRPYQAAVQLVLQDPFASLNPVHTVRYVLRRPLQIHYRMRGTELEEAMLALLRRVALEPAEQFLDKFPHELSGGQRQRIAVARALAVRPRVLLADEPVSMLDVSIRLGVLNLLGGLREDEGLAILYVTHDIASARYIADRIMVMYAGEVVESGPAVAVTDDPQHPYTQLLLRAAPDPEATDSTWQGETGAPPSLIDPPTGCRFHPRCPFAMPVCAEQAPPRVAVTPEHEAACWLHARDGPVQVEPV
jgi:peptide/nickel transport system ATP-binding protein